MKLCFLGIISAALLSPCFSQNAPPQKLFPIDLPAVMRLAGAQNLDVQIAQERLAEARANRESALWQFVPAITPGVGYRRHDDLTQDVQGRLLDVHKESYSVGPAISVQLDLGDAIYKNLASQQLVKAATFGLESQRHDSVLSATAIYFDFARAHASIHVAQEAIRISDEYVQQIDRAIAAGIAFKGDALRAQVQLEKNRLALRQTIEQQSVAMARLIQVLHLEPAVTLVSLDEDFTALGMISTNLAFSTAAAQAIASRPELARSRHLVEAARDSKRAATIGPLIPSVGAQAFVGGLGGGNQTTYTTLGSSEDYAVTLGWRIGPNGLFDRSRTRSAEARLRAAMLTSEKTADDINQQVAEAFARWQSLTDQLSTSRAAVQAAEGAHQLTKQRKEFGVGAVLENITAEQELTRARMDFISLISEFNKAQFSLLRAMGTMDGAGSFLPGQH